jgi:DNA mismatch repair ATPase MutS
VFVATGLGHPLIEGELCVRNPVSLNAQERFVLVSGSNMSGKSTYLRAIGLNFVLARAGAPVCADSLRMSWFSLATSMRVQDSLQDGKSRFLAEVTRVRDMIDQALAGPLLFLLDELLTGTNSEDRRAGAAGVIAHLLENGASGLLTTHDLALTELVFSRAHLAKNMHFVDHLDGTAMAFDYRLRDGIVPHSNGAAILAQLGILGTGL